jgi:hypothetical protein
VAFFASHAKDLFSGPKAGGPKIDAARQDPAQGQGQGQATVEVGGPNLTNGSITATDTATATSNRNSPTPETKNETKEGAFDRFFSIAQLKERKKERGKTLVSGGDGMV